MSTAAFEDLEQALRARGVPALFDRLIEVLRERKQYAQLFEALLMKKRHEIGLPIQGAESVRDLPEEVQVEAENYYVAVCREVGGLYLEEGDIPGAWPYFRSIDEPEKVAEALDSWAPTEATAGSTIDLVIDAALNQGASVRRGFELLLHRHGLTRAIAAFDQHVPARGPVHEHCGRLIVDGVHEELLGKLREDLAARVATESPPAGTTEGLPGLRILLEAHPALCEGRDLHIDVDHLRAALRIAATLEGRESLEKAVELAEYGRRFPRDPHKPDAAPFEDFYADARIFLLALLGSGSDGAVRYFSKKAERSYSSGGKNVPGEVIVSLLHRLGRHAEAVAAFRKHLSGSTDISPTVPSLLDLCEQAGSYDAFLDTSRSRGDLLQYTIGIVHRARREASGSSEPGAGEAAGDAATRGS